MSLMLDSTTLLNDNTIDLIIGVGTVYLTLTARLIQRPVTTTNPVPLPLVLDSTTLLNDNTIDLLIGVGTVVLTLAAYSNFLHKKRTLKKSQGPCNNDGGRYWVRTNDFHRVKVTLYH